jgi:polyribonucleotide nucleotidyltransferase
MDAGISITGRVAGISIGLVTSNDRNGNISKHVIPTDIIGTEDHFGDMDFKLSNTRNGITWVQLDLKIEGLPIEIAREAIMQSKDARMQILNIMEFVISGSRERLKQTAPKFDSMKIDPDKIGALIGPRGKNIKQITEITGAQIDINEDNSRKIIVFAQNEDALERAIKEIGLICAIIKEGQVSMGKVISIKELVFSSNFCQGKKGSSTFPKW